MQQETSSSEVRDYFGMTSPEFRQEWPQLSQDEQNWFKQAVGEQQITEGR